MSMNWSDILERSLSTVVQSFVGTMTAVTAAGSLVPITEWKVAAVAAGTAGVVALTKALGISVARKANGGTDVTLAPGSPAETLAHEVADKLKG